jgi:hypothetical protein
MATVEKAKVEGPITFVDQLRDIQGEYLMLSELYDKQRNYGHKLAETMRLLQYEVDVTIPLNKDMLSEGGRPLKEAFLASESVVIMVDEDDNRISRPLDRFAPDLILSIIQDCTPELKRLISEKRKSTSIKVLALEKVLRELKKAQATFKQTRNDPADAQQEAEADEADPPEIVVGAQQGEVKRETMTMPKQPSRPKETRDEAFVFSGSYLGKKDASDDSADL